MPQPKYPTLHADLLELRENLQRLRPDDHPVLQYNTEGLNATEHAFGLSIEVVNSSTELPNTQHRHTLYAYPHDDDTDKFTCSILLEDGAEPVIKHFDRAQLFKKPRDPRLTLGRIRNKLTAIVDAFEEFDIVQQWPETAPYSGNIVQCIWNISDKLLYFANHGIEASNFLAAVDQIKPLLKQLDYIKQGSWSPSIVDANLYEVGIHFYKFIEKQGQAESEIRQLLNFSSIVRGLINRYPGGAVVNDIIPRLFDRLPTNLRQNLNTYYTNHSSENLQEPPPLTPTPAALLNKLRQLATLYSSSDLTTKHRQKMLRLLSPDRVDQINQYAPPHMTLICETATNIVPYLNDFENYAQSCLHMWERGHQYDPYYAPETDTAAKDDYCKALILQEAQETASMLIDSLAGSNHEALEHQLDKDLQKLLNSSFMLAAIAAWDVAEMILCDNSHDCMGIIVHNKHLCHRTSWILPNQ